MRTPEYWKKDLWVRILPPVRGQNQTQDSREGSTNAANVLSRGPYCRWTRVRNAIAWRKTQNEKFPKYVSLGPPTTRKMYILRPFWVDQVHRRHAKSYFLRRRRTCRRTQYIRINLGRKTGFVSTQKAFGSTQKLLGRRKTCYRSTQKLFRSMQIAFEPVSGQNIFIISLFTFLFTFSYS